MKCETCGYDGLDEVHKAMQIILDSLKNADNAKITDLQRKLQIAREALDEALSYRLHYKNDDGSEPDIFDEDSWSDVGARELTDILVDVLKIVKRARKALEEMGLKE